MDTTMVSTMVTQEQKLPFFSDPPARPPISINSLYYFIMAIVSAFNEWEEHLQMPFFV